MHETISRNRRSAVGVSSKSTNHDGNDIFATGGAPGGAPAYARNLGTGVPGAQISMEIMYSTHQCSPKIYYIRVLGLVSLEY